jgi:MYXO-CTERM domain-containing protein
MLKYSVPVVWFVRRPPIAAYFRERRRYHVNKKAVSGIIALAGLAAVAAPAFGQASTANQRWQIRYVVERFFDASEGGGLASTQVFQMSWNGSAWDSVANGNSLILVSSSGNLSSKANIGRVDVTYQGRVGIVGQNNSNPGDTGVATSRNYGVNRLGGSGVAGSATTNPSGFFLRFADPSVYTDASINPHRLERGATGETRGGNGVNDTNGNPVAGTFMPFRVGFTPTGAPFAQGSNTDGNNGAFYNPASGGGGPSLANDARMGGLTGARGSGFGTDGTTTPVGQATLDGNNVINGGEFANYYKLSYFPKPDYSNIDAQVYRQVTVTIGGGTASQPRYLHARNTDTTYSSSNGPATPTATTFAFFVPTPGAAALVGLAGLATLRRRR